MDLSKLRRNWGTTRPAPCRSSRASGNMARDTLLTCIYYHISRQGTRRVTSTFSAPGGGLRANLAVALGCPAAPALGRRANRY